MKINKLLTTLSLSLLVSTTYGADTGPAYGIHTRSIKLESGILSKVDGIFFDGDTIGPLKRYQYNLRTFLIGIRGEDGKRHPQYTFESNLYTMQQLSRLETTRGSNEELKNLLRQIRSDFETLSMEFRGVARGSKPFMATLVEESCARRGRLHNSILYIWAKTDEAEEEQLFDDHIHTIRDLEMFFTDLHNFLGDLMESCPKACRQFQEKVGKFNKIKGLLLELGLSTETQKEFLKQINHSLAKLKTDDINLATVRKLFDEFNNEK